MKTTKTIAIFMMVLSMFAVALGSSAIPTSSACCATLYVMHTNWDKCTSEGWGFGIGTQMNFFYGNPKICSVEVFQTNPANPIMSYAGNALVACQSCVIEFVATGGNTTGLSGCINNTGLLCANNLEIQVYGNVLGVQQLVFTWIPHGSAVYPTWKNFVSPKFNLGNGPYTINIINPSAKVNDQFLMDNFRMGY